MAYDEVTKKLVLFGGYDVVNWLGDTWIFDGATTTWTQAAPTSSPASATGPAFFTDPASGHVINFGGFALIFYHNETWEWTGSDWLQLNPATVPGGPCAGRHPGRRAQSRSRDPAWPALPRQRSLRLGGRDT